MENSIFNSGVDFTRDLMSRVKELRAVGAVRRSEVLDVLADSMVDMLYDLAFCMDYDGTLVDLVHSNLDDDDNFEVSEEDALTVIMQMREVNRLEDELNKQLEMRARLRGTRVEIFEVVSASAAESVFREAIVGVGYADNADFIVARMLVEAYNDWHDELDERLMTVLFAMLQFAKSLCERSLSRYDGRPLSRSELGLQIEGSEVLTKVNNLMDELLAEHPDLDSDGSDCDGCDCGGRGCDGCAGDD